MSWRAGGGLRPWLAQRLAAVYLAAYVGTAGAFLVVAGGLDYGVWRDWLGRPWVAVASLLALLAVLVHAWVGLRDVTMDYVRPFGARLAVLALVALGLGGLGLWGALLLLGAAL